MFVDESTTPPKPGRVRSPFFILAGVIIPEAKWHHVAKELQALKDKSEFRVRGEIKWRYFGADNTDPKNTVKHLDQQMRDKFRDEFFSILTNLRSISVIACVTRIEAAYQKPFIKTDEDLYHFTYKPVSERFQYFLQDATRVSGNTTLGIIVADPRGREQDDGLRRQHQKLVFADTSTISRYDNLVESLFFTPSHHSVGIQFADMVAGAISRRFNSSKEGHDKYYKSIQSLFRRNPATNAIKGYGLVRFPDESLDE